jgi:hypothetical protein
MDEPPILQSESAPPQGAELGRVGLYVSLAPVVALAAMLLAKPG